jgi:uncharacterized Zn finger protein (UPF0148 family)
LIEDYCIILTSNEKGKFFKDKNLVVNETMRFCPDCDNILIPKNKKLYCKACEKEFEIDSNNNDYNIIKTIKHDDREAAPIVIKKVIARSKISDQDRKAFEEFFDVGDANGY